MKPPAPAWNPLAGRFLRFGLAATVLVATSTMVATSRLIPARAQEPHALPPVEARCNLTPGPRRGVTGVVDAQTLQLDDGTFVRLTGALAPHVSFPRAASVALVPNSPLPNSNVSIDSAGQTGSRDDTALIRKTRAELVALVTGRSVELAYGKTRKDRYGHRLAQVFILPDKEVDPKAGANSGANGQDERLWLQGYLVANGLARAYSIPGSGNCLSRLVALERRAIDARTGLWHHAAFQIRNASHVGELARYRSTFQVVEGRVSRVARTRFRVYLNFGRNWRNDTTLGMNKALTSRLSKALAPRGMELADLEGRRVRIRGWIEMRNGPFITADNIGQIELLPE